MLSIALYALRARLGILFTNAVSESLAIFTEQWQKAGERELGRALPPPSSPRGVSEFNDADVGSKLSGKSERRRCGAKCSIEVERESNIRRFSYDSLALASGFSLSSGRSRRLKRPGICTLAAGDFHRRVGPAIQSHLAPAVAANSNCKQFLDEGNIFVPEFAGELCPSRALPRRSHTHTHIYDDDELPCASPREKARYYTKVRPTPGRSLPLPELTVQV